MKIVEISSIEAIVPLHEQIFEVAFPYESYEKKCRESKVLIYAYYDQENMIGYSLIVVQEEKKNLYAWYGGTIPSYQEKGITKEFFQILIQKAQELHMESVTLATTNIRPNMIAFAVNYGFDIVDIKKRDSGEGNKIYFQYWIYPESTFTISLYDENQTRITIPKLQSLLIYAYKHNCVTIFFENIVDEEDQKMIMWAKQFTRHFIRKMTFQYSGNKRIIDLL